jgi:hypothetical protein
LFLAVFASILLALPGCSGGKQQWEITVENKSDEPCSFFVIASADGNLKANVEKIAKGQAVSLTTGYGDTVVQSVKVVRGKDEQTVTPKADLPAGKRYAIVVTADGKVETSIADR